MSSLESKKLSLEFAEFALSAAVGEATREITPLALEHRVSVCSLLEPSLPDRVAGDAAGLRTILVALLSAATRSVAGGEVKIAGFPSGQNNVMLELMFEVTASTFAPGGPALLDDGLLASAKDVAEGLGGELGVHSQSGSAPVLWCRIPVQQAISPLPAQIEWSGQQRAETAGAEKDVIRILMAEDNSINQRVGKLILQRAGYVIDLVSDGSEAVEAHTSQPYDIILMDCQMPIMDGFEATRRIRANGQHQPIIIAVTANALVGERERCLAAGMDDYLSKPFQAEQLVAIVAKWAKSARTR